MIEYHIHADLDVRTGEFEEILESQGFVIDNFSLPLAPFTPRHHYTLKVHSGVEFRDAWKKVKAAAIQHQARLRGYLEGEIAHITHFADVPLVSAAQNTPFSCSLTRLPAGDFREDEIHVEFDRDRTDPRVRMELERMSFRQAFYPYLDGSGTGEIWTIQGTTRHIQFVVSCLEPYLRGLGGMVKGEMDRETVAEYWLSSIDIEQAPVISGIVWR